MRICFVAHKCLPFHAHSLDEAPLGGIETSIIRLSAELAALGHEVKVFTHHESPPPSTPAYLPITTFESERETDVIISMRDWLPLFVAVKAKRKFFWTGDSYDQLQNYGLGDRRVIAGIDGFLAVSAWHATTVSARSGFPIEKAWVLRNGVHLAHFEGTERRNRKRLIYSSMPYRGLRLVPPLFQILRRKHADAEMHIFSGYQVYGGNPEPAQAGEWLELQEAAKKVEGCFVHGNVPQQELAREYMRAGLLFYPNIFEETSCITAIEAQAGGCPIVTSDLGALKETVGPAGVVIGGKPGSAEYNRAFLEAADKIISDDGFFQQLSEAGYKRARELYGWSTIARRFEQYLKAVHEL